MYLQGQNQNRQSLLKPPPIAVLRIRRTLAAWDYKNYAATAKIREMDPKRKPLKPTLLYCSKGTL